MFERSQPAIAGKLAVVCDFGEIMRRTEHHNGRDRPYTFDAGQQLVVPANVAVGGYQFLHFPFDGFHMSFCIRDLLLEHGTLNRYIREFLFVV